MQRFCFFFLVFFLTMNFRMSGDFIHTFGKVLLEYLSYTIEVNSLRHWNLEWNAWEIKLLSKYEVYN